MDTAKHRRAVNTETDPEPRSPDQPDPLDCCGSGCVRCIFDVHDEAMQRYREERAAWRARRNNPNPSGHE